ncbi:MAG TPA: alpha/beta hydrolase-fold protein [Nitrososphaeraceae archaeon]|nr:alpha/beta hydrolase-fold protein [Nitrososphaeraceae archaeon]
MTEYKGRIITHTHESTILRSNPLNDPHVREIIVYVPPNYSQSHSNGYPAAIGLSGFAGNGRTFLNFDPLGENIEERMNRLIADGKLGHMILVIPDCFTKFGGNQYINSTATGRYEDYIVTEIVPFIQSNYNTSSFGLWGKSSGGYGSLVLGMKYPEIFEAIACHSGDSAFEYCYLPDFPSAYETFKEAGGVKKWFNQFWKKQNRKQKKDFVALNILAMAAHYSPDTSSELGVKLPFDIETGEILEDVWKMWKALDPVKMINEYQNNLRKLKLLYIDCGNKDEFNLHLGARMIHNKLNNLDITHYYEEFDGGHSNTSFRYDNSFPMICSSIT